MDFSGFIKSPKSVAELFRHARPEHIYLPHPDFDRRTTYRQWSANHAAFAYDTVPECYRAVFPRAWQETWAALRRSNLSEAKVRFRARVVIGQYVLAFSRLTGIDVRSSCGFLLESGFAAVFRHRMIEDNLLRDGAAGWHFERLVNWAKLDAGNVESLRQWAYEADVPDPRTFFRTDWNTAAECAAAARACPEIGIPVCRRVAARWLAAGKTITDAERGMLARSVANEAQILCNHRGYSLDDLWGGIEFWSAIPR